MKVASGMRDGVVGSAQYEGLGVVVVVLVLVAFS